MTKQKKCTWIGKSGNEYDFDIYPIGTSFKKVPVNYIFCKQNSAGQWVNIYTGQTGDASERFDGHHAMRCIRRHGATHIQVRRNDGGEDARRAVETDIILKYDPPCNKK